MDYSRNDGKHTTTMVGGVTMSGADVFAETEDGKAYAKKMEAERRYDKAHEEYYAKQQREKILLASGRDAPRRVAAAEDYSAQRKATPVFSGVVGYFPDALLEIAKLSKWGNDKHNPNQPLHWSKGKSNDHADCIMRHLIDHGKIDEESGLSHTVAMAWRALALLQTELENKMEDRT